MTIESPIAGKLRRRGVDARSIRYVNGWWWIAESGTTMILTRYNTHGPRRPLRVKAGSTEVEVLPKLPRGPASTTHTDDPMH